MQTFRVPGSGFRFLGIASALFVAVGAYAQEIENEPSEASTSESQAASRKPQASPPEDDSDTILLTATRTPVLYRDASSSATVIGEDQLDATGIPVLTDSLLGVPGLDVRRSGPAGQPTSLFLRGTDSDHTKFLLDNIDIADPSSPGGVPLLDHLFTPGLGRIEVIRGPQSTLYGSDAIGGVVNAFTRSARSGPLSASYEIEGGSFYTSHQKLAVEGANKTVNAFLGFSYLDTEGISASPEGGEKDAYRNAHLSSRLGFDFTDEFKTDVVFHYIASHSEFDLFGADDPINESDSEQFFLKLEPKLFLFDGKWVSKLNLNAGIHERDTFDRFFIGDIYSPKSFNGQAFEADWQNDVQLADWNLLTFGTTIRHERSDTWGVFQDFPPPLFIPTIVERSSDHDRDIASAYIQDQIKLFGGRVHIVPGVRYDRFSDFGAHTSWRIAASYRHLETATTFRGSYGTGFNAPSLFDLFDTSFGNSALEAEESTGWDAGVEQSLWKDKVAVGATYFQNDISELLQFDFATFTIQNLGDARTRGVELFGTLAPCENLTIRPSYTYTDTENLDTGARLLRRPLHKAGVEAIYRFYDERATLGLGVFYIGEREDIAPVTFATVTNDDYWLARLAASFRVNDHLELTGRLENALDEEYQDVLGFASPGFAAYGGVKVGF